MEKLQFPVLKIKGSNYLSWSQNAEIVLNSQGIEDTTIAHHHGDLQTKAHAYLYPPTPPRSRPPGPVLGRIQPTGLMGRTKMKI